METIKNYLETMFMNLPNTEEVRKAKDELWQMMEDEYNGLRKEGKSENEAVGTVISEFGNLDELAEELGIRQVVKPQTQTNQQLGQQPSQQPGQQNGNGFANGYTYNPYGSENEGQSNFSGYVPPVEIPRRMITLEEAKQYLHAVSGQAVMVAIGVMLCILSVCGPIAMDMIHGMGAIGVLWMFGSIGVAVALFVISGIKIEKWSFIKKQPCTMDFHTTNYVKEKKEQARIGYAIKLSIGIVLCVISFVPAAFIDELSSTVTFIEIDELGGLLLFVFVAIGVLLIVLSSMIYSGYTTLLQVNDPSTMAGNYRNGAHEKHYKNKIVEAVMSVFWPTATCLYLIVSFLTFAWWITWIIWPIATIVYKLLEIIFEED